MRFVLTIELGNEAMCTASDIRGALREIAARVRGDEAQIGDSGIVRDENGNLVGAWHVEESR